MTVGLVVMPIFPFIVSMFIFVGRVTMIILVLLAIVFRHMFNMMIILVMLAIVFRHMFNMMIILVMLAIVFRHMFNMMMGRILVIAIIITVNVLVLMPSEMSVILF